MNRCVACGEEVGDAVCGCGGATVSGDSSVADDVSMMEGGTPEVRLDVEAECRNLLVKDEGSNPTGSVHDRGAALWVSMADDADEVSLVSPGDSAVSCAAYAARADVDVHAYVPARTRFDVKAMVNVFGGDMTVARGRYDDAVQRFRGDGGDRLPQTSPEYVAGLSGVAEELPPVDHVVLPVGLGATLAGVLAADVDAEVHAVQPEACSPYVDSMEAGEHRVCSEPDTVVGECEVAEPPMELVYTALEHGRRGELEGHRVEDGVALDRCLEVAREAGVDLSPAGGAAVAVARGLSGDVAAVNPAAGRLSADALRNRLVYHGE